MADYLPQKDADFFTWAENLIKYALDNYQKWSVPSPAQTLDKPHGDFDEAYKKYLDPNHGKVDTERKNETKKNFVHELREYCQAWLMHNPNVTDEDRLEMGLPIYDKIKTPHGEPDTRPIFKVLVHDIRRLKLEISDIGSSRIAIPAGYDGAVIYWGFFDTTPVSPDTLTGSTLAKHAHYILSFEETDRGKTVYIAMRWQKGEMKGPWSEMIGVIVP